MYNDNISTCSWQSGKIKVKAAHKTKTLAHIQSLPLFYFTVLITITDTANNKGARSQTEYKKKTLILLAKTQVHSVISVLGTLKVWTCSHQIWSDQEGKTLYFGFRSTVKPGGMLTCLRALY